MSEQIERSMTMAEAPGHPLASPQPERMTAQASRAAEFLKSISHEQRLLILCHLGQGERSVSEIEALLGVRQAAVSQQLARLRFEGLVASRREGKQVIYSLADERARRLIALLYDMFCQNG